MYGFLRIDLLYNYLNYFKKLFYKIFKEKKEIFNEKFLMNTRFHLSPFVKGKKITGKDSIRNFFSDIREKEEKGYDDFLKRNSIIWFF